MTGESMAGRRPAPLRETSSVVRTLVLTVASGGLTFLITNGLHQDMSISIMLSILIGGIALMVRFLVDFEKRLVGVEEMQKAGMAEMKGLILEIGEATKLFGQIQSSRHASLVTELVTNSTRIPPDSPPIIHQFVEAKVRETSELLKQIADGGTATYYGEDRDWLLGLTRTATKGIDAISMAAVDHDLWQSEIGQRYLDAQRRVAEDGRRVRRIFVLDEPAMAADPILRRVYEEQIDMKIQVRLLYWADVPARLRVQVRDLIIFDNALAYETTPTIGDPRLAQVAETRLVLTASRVHECAVLFGELWKVSHEPQPVPDVQRNA
ncbi:hypothetical protein [Actinoplanes sp. NPDC026619]|uniref:hypothetical protein n=1 Tax=Actinoplanes sp. NPDC026619 TaxID=3155798 RepID=UPI0033DAA8FA